MTGDSVHRLRSFARAAFRPDGSDTPDRLAFVMLLVLIAGGPFLYGATLPASLDAGAPAPLGRPLLDIFALLTAAAALMSRATPLKTRPLRLPLGAVAGLTLLGVVQLLPLPEGVMRQFASVNLQIYHETAQILSLFGFTGTPAPRISIAPWETVSAVLGCLAAVALFFAAASLTRVRVRRRAVGWAIVVSAGLQVCRLAALRAGLTGAAPPAGVDAVAALCLGFAACIALGMLWTTVLTNHDRGLDSLDAADRFERRIAPIASRGILWLTLAAGLVWARVPSVTLCAIGASLAALGLAFDRRRRERARRLAGSMGVVIVLGLLLTHRAVASASDPAPAAPEPDRLWRASVDAWRQFPILGSGLGTFREAFRRIQPRELPSLVDRAPSGPLDLLVTGGLVGVLFGATFVVSLMVAFLRAWRAQKHREESATALAALCALLFFWALVVLVGPGWAPQVSALLLACVLGAGWSASQASDGRIH